MNKDRQRVKRREIFGWCCYDFADSAFTTIIVTVAFSVYFTEVVAGGGPGAHTLWGGALAVSQLIAILLSPWLGTLADFAARKKAFLLGMGMLCLAFTATLYFTRPGTVAVALALFIAAFSCYSLGENFNASFLPELSTPQTAGRISGYGWSFGYFGGLGSLALAFALLHDREALDPARMRLLFPLTALFMLVSLIPTAVFLRERAEPQKPPPGRSFFTAGWLRYGAIWRDLLKQKLLLRFFIAFILYMSGLMAVVAFAAIFAERELGFTMGDIVLLFAGLQFSSAAGSFAVGFLQDKIGSRKTLAIALSIWIAVSIGAFFTHGKLAFFLLGNGAGLAIGSTQSASRAVVSMLAPPGQAAKFFGFWGVF